MAEVEEANLGMGGELQEEAPQQKEEGEVVLGQHHPGVASPKGPNHKGIEEGEEGPPPSAQKIHGGILSRGAACP
ncbi:hypothetical protein Thermus72351_22280 [Thermus brockianus]